MAGNTLNDHGGVELDKSTYTARLNVTSKIKQFWSCHCNSMLVWTGDLPWNWYSSDCGKHQTDGTITPHRYRVKQKSGRADYRRNWLQHAPQQLEKKQTYLKRLLFGITDEARRRGVCSINLNNPGIRISCWRLHKYAPIFWGEKSSSHSLSLSLSCVSKSQNFEAENVYASTTKIPAYMYKYKVYMNEKILLSSVLTHSRSSARYN